MPNRRNKKISKVAKLVYATMPDRKYITDEEQYCVTIAGKVLAKYCRHCGGFTRLAKAHFTFEHKGKQQFACVKPPTVLQPDGAPPAVQAVLDQEDIMVKCILPFLGPGQFALCAGVCRSFKYLYKKYFNSIDNPPQVRQVWTTLGRPRAAIPTDTLTTAVLSAVTNGEQCVYVGRPVYAGRLSVRELVQAAAEHGNIPALNWLVDQILVGGHAGACETSGSTTFHWIFDMAVEHSLDAIVEWALDQGSDRAWDYLMDEIETSWYNEVSSRFSDPCPVAAKNGDLNILKVLHKKGFFFSREATISAAKNGHLEVIKFLHNNELLWEDLEYVDDYPIGLSRAADVAAANGHWNIHKYALDHRL